MYTFGKQNLRVSTIINQLAAFALFRFFNLSRIQDDAVLTFLNTRNDLSTIKLSPNLIVTLNLFICSS